MRVREPVVAGLFYPAERRQCLEALTEMLDTASTEPMVDQSCIGGLVPQAGWAYSGKVAARVFKKLSESPAPQCVVIFGGVHRTSAGQAALFAGGRWETPIGPVAVDARLAERLIGYTNLIIDDPYCHENEHSIEVQLPFIRHLFPTAMILPICVPSFEHAAEVGQAVARTVAAYKYDVLIVGTTDLTQYGTQYGFTPVGQGTEANTWAKEVNDERFLGLVRSLKSAAVVGEAQVHRNASSSGAVAAALAAVAGLGASEGIVLDHITSSEVVEAQSGKPGQDSVGYAGVVFSCQ